MESEIINAISNVDLTIPQVIVLCVLIIVVGAVIWKFIDGLFG